MCDLEWSHFDTLKCSYFYISKYVSKSNFVLRTFSFLDKPESVEVLLVVTVFSYLYTDIHSRSIIGSVVLGE